MTSYPNQLTIKIKRAPRPSRNFVTFQVSTLQFIAKDLSSSALLVYLELISNKDGYEYIFSPRALEKRGLMPESSARRARQELEKKGYIVNGVLYEEPQHIRKMRDEIEKEAAENVVTKTDFGL